MLSIQNDDKDIIFVMRFASASRSDNSIKVDDTSNLTSDGNLSVVYSERDIIGANSREETVYQGECTCNLNALNCPLPYKTGTNLCAVKLVLRRIDKQSVNIHEEIHALKALAKIPAVVKLYGLAQINWLAKTHFHPKAIVMELVSGNTIEAAIDKMQCDSGINLLFDCTSQKILDDATIPGLPHRFTQW